jgi:hypothetical protein
MKKLLVSSLTVASLLAGASVARSLPNRVIVDDFTEPLNSEIIVFPSDGIFDASSLETGLSPAAVLGGNRLTTLEILEPIDSASEFDSTEVTSGSTDTGVLDQSIFGEVGFLTQTMLTWNGGTGLNQSVAGYDRFDVIVNRFDLYNSPITTDIGTITLRVIDDLGNISELSKTLDQMVEGADPLDLKFYFSDFSDFSVFANLIDEIQLEITGQQGLLFTLEEITINTTPEPSLGVSLLALAGVQVVVRGWRKRK